MIRLHIEPQPPADEATAIEAALKELVAHRAAGAKKLRYSDVAEARKVSRGDIAAYARIHWRGCVPTTQIDVRDCGWSGVARFEALTQSV